LLVVVVVVFVTVGVVVGFVPDADEIEVRWMLLMAIAILLVAVVLLLLLLSLLAVLMELLVIIVADLAGIWLVVVEGRRFSCSFGFGSSILTSFASSSTSSSSSSPITYPPQIIFHY
jgi:hypothetical protein